jgi:sporulation protein YlmC with PRC-barrel domain
MSVGGDIDLGLGILDHQLLDSDGRRCGKVDDLELEGVAEEQPRVAAILVGPGAWKDRGPLGRLAARIAGGRTVRVPWDEVTDVDSAVRLRRTARELRLGRGDDRAARLIERIPGSSL